jgi:hypothetical protein
MSFPPSPATPITTDFNIPGWQPAPLLYHVDFVKVFMASYKGNVVLFCKSCNPNIIIRIGHPLL